MMNSINIKMIVFGIGLRIIEVADLTLKGKVKLETQAIASRYSRRRNAAAAHLQSSSWLMNL
jgi:hypothetical protein